MLVEQNADLGFMRKETTDVKTSVVSMDKAYCLLSYSSSLFFPKIQEFSTFLTAAPVVFSS